MATDYDAPRKTDDELSEDSHRGAQGPACRQELRQRSTRTRPRRPRAFELPGADLSNEELSVRVLPRQADEFTCSSCFLVHHRSQLAKKVDGPAGVQGVRSLTGSLRGDPTGRGPGGSPEPADAGRRLETNQ